MVLTSPHRLVLMMLTLFTASAFAYELQPAGRNGTPLRWERPKIEMAVSTSFSGAPNIRGGEDAVEAIRRAAETWSRAGGVEIAITISDATSVSPSGPRGDGVSLITIAQTPENLVLFAGANSHRPALTRIFFDRRGHIVEADIVINPYFSTSTDGTPGSFDLESTMVHEFGHALGLGHSELPGASMNDTSSRNGLYTLPFTIFRTLSRDDISGLRALYGAPADSSDCCGSVKGLISADGEREGRYQVWLESVETGAVEAGTLTTAKGAFRLDGLSSGMYQVFAREPSGGAGAMKIGTVAIARGKTSEISASSGFENTRALLSSAGFNGEIASTAVPVNTGAAYRIYLSVKGPIGDFRFEASSPGIRFDPASIETLDYGEGGEVLTVIVEIGDEIAPGDYSIRLIDGSDIVDILPAALAVEKDKNPWIHRRL